MGICLVQDKYVKEWLIVAKWDHKKTKWIIPVHIQKIPYEIEDTRFLYAMRYLECGYKFYKYGAKLGKDYPVIIDPKIVEQGIKAWENNPFQEKAFDTAGFWNRTDLGIEPKLTKKEIEKQKQLEAKRKINEAWEKVKNDLLPANSWLTRC